MRSIEGSRSLRSCRPQRPQKENPGSTVTTSVLLIVLVLVSATAALGGCGQEPAAPATTTGTSTTEASTAAPTVTTTDGPSATATTSAPTVQISAYFVRGEKMAPAHRSVPATTAVAAAAVNELLSGPASAEREAGLSTAIPGGTILNGVVIDDAGNATVDLSQRYESGGGSLSMSLRLAQVVFTLTQFPTVKTVTFELDGKPVEVFSGEGLILDTPVGRGDYEELTPAILVETPAVGDTVSSPLRLTGTANVFEAVFFADITDWDGRVVAHQRVEANAGTGTRGGFDVTIPFTIDREGRGALIVYALSPKDGARTDIVEIPLELAN